MTKDVFDFHIVRQTDSGATYEDRVENLSESEREVTGLIFALAGYLAHEVHETVPFMLLGSLNISGNSSAYLIVALLPEDARALPDGLEQITTV